LLSPKHIILILACSTGILMTVHADGALPSSRDTPEAIRTLPSFGQILWEAKQLPFVGDGPKAGVSGAGMAVVDGKIYFAGGFIPGGDETNDRVSGRTSRWAHCFDPQNSGWTRLPDMPGRREYTRAIGGEQFFFVLGGGSQFRGAKPSYRPFGDVFRLDLSSTNPSWGSISPLAVPRTHMAVGLVAGKLIVAGGNQYDFSKRGYHSSTIRATTEVFDPAKPESGWQTVKPIPGGGRGWTASAVCGDRFWVLAGLKFSDARKQIRLDDTLCYDPVNDQWAQHAKAPVAISGWEGAAYDDRYIIAVGGVIGEAQGGKLWNDIPMAYDTQKDRWFRIEGPLPAGAVFNDPGVCIIGDTIYVAGAEGPGGSHFNHWLVGKIKPTK
jgi:hypothetical protein